MTLTRLLFLPVAIASGVSFAAEPDTSLVRESDPLSPEEERIRLKVPEGFAVQLFAAEPMINKPMNMAFDARGRLWVSSTVEYPFPGARERWSDDICTRLNDTRDAIRILEDTDGDGQADRVSVFADGLNVPNGVLPWGTGCIAWSIPNIWYLQDTDGDGVCDRREILFGPLGYEKDTHGNISSLTMGLDGWVYATHGFNNTSRFAVRPDRLNGRQPGDPGTTLELNSGNVFRFRPDGSEIQIWSHGQVNPFGLARDSWGNLYSADCHSNPVSLLIRGGWYPSFGKPHDGLGFAPVMCEHAHGSTGLCGITYIDGGVWGPEWDDHLFIGNCVTSRVNHDIVQWNGATPKAIEQPDFVVSEDPWFRPVNLHLGPDGALYVADFYNRIIGHYEVDLYHPGRDRERGRIWRIVRTGMTGSLKDEDFTKLDNAELNRRLGDRNLTRRHFAARELVRRGYRPYAPEGAEASVTWRIMAAWVRQGIRLAEGLAGSAADEHALRTLGDPQAAVQAVLLRASAPEEPLPAAWRELLLPDSPPRVAVAAAQAIAWAEPEAGSAPVEFAGAMIRRLQTDPDELLRHVLTRSLHRVLSRPGAITWLQTAGVLRSGADEEIVAPVIRMIPGQEAAAWTLERLKRKPEGADVLTSILPGIVRYFGGQDEAALAGILRERFADRPDDEVRLVVAMGQGIGLRGTPAADPTREWAAAVAGRLFDSLRGPAVPAWTLHDTAESPWGTDRRHCADGVEMDCLSSLPAPRGPAIERLTGTLRSRAFAVPPALSFWLCGHSGHPSQPAHGRNAVRLVEAGTGRVLRQALPPRDDTARRVDWDLQDVPAGTEVYLELTDGDRGDAWAWLAAGRFEPPVVSASPDPRPQQLQQLAEVNAVAGRQDVDDFLIDTILTDPVLDGSVAAAIGRSVLPRAEAPSLRVLLQVASFPGALPLLREPGAVEGREIQAPLLQRLPARLQSLLAALLCESRESAARFVGWIADGLAPAQLLQQPAVAQRLAALNDASLTEKAAALTANLPPPSEETARLLVSRLEAWTGAAPDGMDTSRGEEIFSVHCAICHKVGNSGNLIGPQLDGIGSRGAERLIEDLLDPNRNVDVSFRTHVLTLRSGEVKAGLIRRKEGGAVILADAAGQESAVPESDIVSDEESPLSLMPATFHLTIPEEDFNILISWLLER